MSKIFEAMCAIQKEVETIAKTEKNVQQNYSFRSIDQVYESLHGLLAKHGVFTVPEVIESQTEERTSKSGGVLISRILKIKYTFYADDGSNVFAIIQGEGMDSGDKGSNKAMSAAHKYLFLQVFSIPTSDKKDADYDSPEPDKPAKSNKITEKQRKRLFAIAKKNGVSNDELKGVISTYGYEHTDNINREDYDKICKEIDIFGEGDNGSE